MGSACAVGRSTDRPLLEDIRNKHQRDVNDKPPSLPPDTETTITLRLKEELPEWSKCGFASYDALAMPGGGTGSMTGTSMASPHIAGLAAYLSSVEGIKASTACERIVELATKGAIKGKMPASTVNNIAFNENLKAK